MYVCVDGLMNAWIMYLCMYVCMIILCVYVIVVCKEMYLMYVVYVCKRKVCMYAMHVCIVCICARFVCNVCYVFVYDILFMLCMYVWFSLDVGAYGLYVRMYVEYVWLLACMLSMDCVSLYV